MNIHYAIHDAESDRFFDRSVYTRMISAMMKQQDRGTAKNGKPNEENGMQEKIDRRSYQIRGIAPERGNINREIKHHNENRR